MATRVLLTVDEGPGSLAATRALRDGGYEPYVAVAQPDTYAARSRAAAGVVHVPDPKDEPDDFAAAIGEAARRLGAAAVLPATEGGLRALTGREGNLPPDVAVGTCAPHVVERARDKTLLEQLATAAGLDVPATVEVTAADVDARADGLVFPAIVKPTASVLPTPRGTLRSLEVERVESLGELRSFLAGQEADDRWLVQQWVSGTLAASCGVAWHGDVVCLSHQVSPRIWPPRFGISSYAVTVPADPRVDAGVRALLRTLEWSGVFGVQFLRDGDHSWLIDLNPRIYGSIQLAVAAGHNLPAIWADLLLGRTPRIPEYRAGVRYRVEEDDVRALVHLFRTGRRREALAGLAPRPRTAHAVFSLRDPLPSALSVRKALSRLSAAPERESCRGSSRAR